MIDYAVDEAAFSVVAPDGSSAFSTDVDGLSTVERLAIARALCEFANGGEPDLPPAVRFHWAIVGPPRASSARLYAKAPTTIPEFGAARVWMLFAFSSDVPLARRVAEAANRALGWDRDENGIHRNIVANTAVVVRPDPAGGWRLSVGGEPSGLFTHEDDAKAAALAAAPDWDDPTSRKP